METNRNIILDLLPLYIAEEVSDETRLMIEEYLDSHPDMRAVIDRLKNNNLSGAIPAPQSQEKALKDYQRAKTALNWRILLIAGVMVIITLLILGAIALMFFQSQPL